MKQSKFPKGWDEEKVHKVLDYYEKQIEEEALAEYEAAYEDRTQTTIDIPVELVPAVRELIAKHQCSRNPVLAQCLSYFHRIEKQGSGFRRMREQMLNHGLDMPLIGTDAGYFQVTFPGPGDNIERLRVPEQLMRATPAVEAQLNERQRKMMQWLVVGKELTSRQCKAEFGVTRAITAVDFGKLVEMGLAEKLGAGRSTRYRLKELV